VLCLGVENFRYIYIYVYTYDIYTYIHENKYAQMYMCIYKYITPHFWCSSWVWWFSDRNSRKSGQLSMEYNWLLHSIKQSVKPTFENSNMFIHQNMNASYPVQSSCLLWFLKTATKQTKLNKTKDIKKKSKKGVMNNVVLHIASATGHVQTQILKKLLNCQFT